MSLEANKGVAKSTVEEIIIQQLILALKALETVVFCIDSRTSHQARYQEGCVTLTQSSSSSARQAMKMLNFVALALFIFMIFYVLVVGEALLLPLVVAIALWYLIITLSNLFAQIKIGSVSIPGPLCMVASILTFIGLIWALVDFLSASVGDVSEVFPIYQQNLVHRVENTPLAEYLPATDTGGLLGMAGNWFDLPQLAGAVVGSFTSLLANGGIILIYISFLLLEQGNLDRKISNLVADQTKEQEVRKIISRIRDDIQKYISIKMFTSSLTGLLSYGILTLLDVDFAGVWGLLIFLLNFIPTVGSIIATIFPSMIALAQSDGYTLFVLVLAGIGAVQIAIGNILEPRLMGSSFNLSPLIILLNLALWGSIWGVPGMFLCVPFLIIITIVLSHFPQTRPIAIILSSDGRLQVPEERAAGGFDFSKLNPDTALLGTAAKTTGENAD